VHVLAGNREAKIWLADLTIATNAGFPTHELRGILRELKPYREALLDEWNEHFGNRDW
jgi:hypothetical protein